MREDAPLHEHPRLLHIPFGYTGRLTRNVHLFTYRDVQFKLIQNPLRGQNSKYAHNLLAIVGDDTEKQMAYSAAHEFLSALAWENWCEAYLGIPTWRRPPRTTLKEAKPSIWAFPPIPHRGSMGYSISKLPRVETDEQRLALSLCMEAAASNTEYLKFLFYWQVLSIGAEPIGAANNMLRRLRKDTARLRGGRIVEAVAKLPLRGKSIGNYFADNCRDAIGHIVRKPGKTRLAFDSENDRRRISASADAVELFAKYYVEHSLQLNKSVALFQLKPGTFPVYLPPENAVGKYVRPALPKLFTARGKLRTGPAR